MDIKDITTRKDIEQLVNDFYTRVRSDETIGIIFNEVVKMDWDTHIPLIVDFWETILLDNPVYQRNAMEKHYEINRVYPLKQEHFDAWLRLFNETVDAHFNGSTATLAKKRASSIASVMLFKMNSARNSES
jgi:hemoglobin